MDAQVLSVYCMELESITSIYKCSYSTDEPSQSEALLKWQHLWSGQGGMVTELLVECWRESGCNVVNKHYQIRLTLLNKLVVLLICRLLYKHTNSCNTWILLLCVYLRFIYLTCIHNLTYKATRYTFVKTLHFTILRPH